MFAGGTPTVRKNQYLVIVLTKHTHTQKPSTNKLFKIMTFVVVAWVREATFIL